MARGHFDGFALHLTRLLTATPRFNELMVADDFGNTAVNGIGGLKELHRGGVRKLDIALRIGDENTIGHLVEDGGETSTLCI